MLNPNLDPSEELRKLRMSDEEMFTVFVALGNITTRVHFLFHPSADFEEYAEMTGNHNPEIAFFELMELNSAMGEKLNEIVVRSINSDNDPTQPEINRDFFGIMENGFGNDPEPPTE